MRGKTLLALLATATLLPAAARAEETEEEPVSPRTPLKVLQDPRDIASFYRAEGGRSAPSVAANPYAIAGYYRSQQAPAPVVVIGDPLGRWDGRGRRSGTLGLVGLRRAIDEDTDVFLAIPVGRR